MKTQHELEQKHENIYYFKNLDKNPLTAAIEAGDTMKIENMEIKVQAVGQLKLNGEPHGFIAGDTVE